MSVRDEIIKEWAMGETDTNPDENLMGWVESDDPVTLHEPHQRIDKKDNLSDYERGERGCWCGECGAKITLGPGLEKEYGHYAECEFRNVDRVPNNKRSDRS